MKRLRIWAVAALALTLAGNSTKAENRGATTTGWNAPAWNAPAPSPTAADDRACVIYSLGEMGIDADLGQWVAETIPEVIEPGSWKGAGAVRYYAPKNILVVRHSAAVQAKVDGFLKNIKTAHATAKPSKKATPAVVPADYRTANVLRTSAPVAEPSSYPVPPPVKAPKHLFHFLIRYEGEGIIDDNVVKFMKLQAQGEKKAETPSYAAPTTPAAGSAPIAGYGSSAAGSSLTPSTTPPQPTTAQTLTPANTTPAQPLTPADTKETEGKKTEKKSEQSTNPF